MPSKQDHLLTNPQLYNPKHLPVGSKYLPVHLAVEGLPEDFFDLLGLELIARENVNLTPMHHGHLSAG